MILSALGPASAANRHAGERDTGILPIHLAAGAHSDERAALCIQALAAAAPTSVNKPCLAMGNTPLHVIFSSFVCEDYIQHVSCNFKELEMLIVS